MSRTKQRCMGIIITPRKIQRYLRVHPELREIALKLGGDAEQLAVRQMIEAGTAKFIEMARLVSRN